MNRGKFLKTSILGIAGLAFTSPISLAMGVRKNLPDNWGWMNGSAKTPADSWKELFDKLLKGNVEGLLLHGSNELYEKTGPIALQSGMKIHTWRWTMNRGEYMEEHPQWYSVNRRGESVIDKPPYVGYYRWLCPSHPEVKEVLIRDYAELASLPGIQGVHLDYVRYCDQFLPVGLLPKYNLVQDHEMPEYDYCYCPLCRSIFKEKQGYDPLELADPGADEAWRQFRLDQLVNLVQDLAKAIHLKGSLITAAVFPTPEMSRRMVRQDWSRFNLDAYFPMLYQDYYLKPTSWVAECATEIRKEVDKQTPVYAGLMMDSQVFTPEVLTKTLKQVKIAGAQGISAFTAGRLTEEQFRVLRRG